MWNKPHLQIPGPVSVPPDVAAAGQTPLISYRSEEFGELLQSAVHMLKPIFGTENGSLVVLTGSGTAALEAAASNLLSSGEKVVVLVSGVFGQRWAEICRIFGAEVTELNCPHGQGFAGEKVDLVLRNLPPQTLVFATQNETSTGVLNDIPAIAAVCQKHDAILAVDAVSSLGGAEMAMDGWGVDLVCSASQKCLMTPPGLSFVAFGARAKQRMAAVKTPRYYFDLLRYDELLLQGLVPFTPNISHLFALRAALERLHHHGLAESFTRHRLMAAMARAGVEALGLQLLAPSRWASPTTTAILHPRGDELRAYLKRYWGLQLAGGLGPLTGKIFRIGHMGYASATDVLTCLAALETVLGLRGAATVEAERVFQQHLPPFGAEKGLA